MADAYRSVDPHRNFRVHVLCTLKSATQVDWVVKKAAGVFSFSGKAWFKCQEVIWSLYKILAGHNLTIVRSSGYRITGRISRLWRVQMRMLAILECISYQERLDNLG